MNIIDAMATEYEHEAGTTRKLLERIPDDKLGYRPHEKSMTMGRLASHIAENHGWVKSTIEDSEFNVSEDYKPFNGASTQEILDTFDRLIAEAKSVMKSGVSDDALMQPWALKMNGQVMFEMPKVQVLRTFVLSHQIHHRGQLDVYLRLNDIPLPSIYGPSADEQG